MKLLVIMTAALFALAGCQTSKIDTAIQDNLPRICSGASIAHTAFTAVAAVASIPDKTVRREAAAYAALEPLCVNPSQQTTAGVLIAAAQAYAIIATSLADAKKAEARSKGT